MLDDPPRRTERESGGRLTRGRSTTTSSGTKSYSASIAVIARNEQLYPFPVEQPAGPCSRYPALAEVVWAQEEPQSMGAWRAIRHRLEEALPPGGRGYVGRPWRASPSEGYPTAHLVEQDRIVREALSGR